MALKFEDIVQQFQHNVFGNLTTIRKNDGIIWFLGGEIQEMLGYTNITKAIKDAKLKPNEKLILNKSDNPKFFNELTNQSLVSYGKRSKSMTFISESGLYKLIMRSNKPEAEIFTDWITGEVIPFFRKGVEDNLIIKRIAEEIGEHTNPTHQKYESKVINHFNFEKGGVGDVIKYNVNSCKDHSGSTPRQLIKFAKESGIPSAKRTSGKEVLRLIDKPVASAMSLNDKLVSSGLSYEKALEISNGAGKELFRQLIEVGFMPKELDM